MSINNNNNCQLISLPYNFKLMIQTAKSATRFNLIVPIFKNFSGGACPQTPLGKACSECALHTVHVHPPIYSTTPYFAPPTITSWIKPCTSDNLNCELYITKLNDNEP